MSETQETTTEAKTSGLQMSTTFAFKEGMSSYIDEKGDMFAVTVLRFEPWVVSQVKTSEKDGYAAVQFACRPKKAKNSNKAETTKLKAAGFEAGAQLLKEIREELPEGVAVGQKMDISSLAAGDAVKVTARSNGKGFAGVVRRWNTKGGPATHGSGFHRSPGSSGNRTWPGRIMPGKKFPGHLGDENTTVRSSIVEVLPDDNIIIVKGAIPGARHALVKLTKV